MENKKILIVDDDCHICELLKIALAAENFIVHEVYNGLEAAELLNSEKFDLLILDIMMPQKDGWEILRQVRSHIGYKLPIILLTAKVEEADKVLGLELGADDYVTKPFSPREVVARVKAQLRRIEEFENTKVIEAGDLTINIQSYKLEKNGIELQVSPKEFEVLVFLAEHKEQIFTREALLDKIWGYEYHGGTRTVDEHIKRLRNKIESDGKYTYLHTVWGVGYKFEVKTR